MSILHCTTAAEMLDQSLQQQTIIAQFPQCLKITCRARKPEAVAKMLRSF